MSIKHDQLAVSLASHLDPFLELFHQLGTPYEKALFKACLPGSWNDLDYLPSTAIINFVNELALKEGVTEIGLRLSQLHKPLHPSLRTQLEMADTPLNALQIVSSFSPLQGSHLRIWTQIAGSEVWLCHFGANPKDLTGSEQFEWMRIERLLEVIRRFLGSSWNPTHLWLYTLTAVSPRFKELTGDCEIKRHPHFGIIPIPFSDLELDDLKQLPVLTVPSPIQASWIDRLRQVLPAYIGERDLNPDSIAQLTGLSKRSLQRHLNRQNLSVSAMVDEAKLKRAIDLLTNTDHTLAEIASQCGYTDKSNFSRFFRRMTGLSPGEVRISL